jgi:hypothetical protein
MSLSLLRRIKGSDRLVTFIYSMDIFGGDLLTLWLDYQRLY